MDRPTYDRSKLHEGVKQLFEFQVGDEFYLLRDEKIVKAVIYRIILTLHNTWSPPKYKLEKSFEIDLLINGTIVKLGRDTKLFKTREEAADQFLKDNNVPADLLRVLKQDKPKTTVGDLITQLNAIDPETDLEGYYWRIVKDIQAVYLDKIGVEVNSTSDYWDCECERRYIHPASDEICPHCKAEKTNQPDSRISEIKPENMFYPQRGE